MSSNFDPLKVLGDYSRIPMFRIRFESHAKRDTVESISNGILFLIAFWSGPSIQAFSKLTEALCELECDGYELVAVDVDGSPEITRLIGGGNAPTGAGEAAFCRGGRIVHVAVIGHGENSAQCEVNAREFLSTLGAD